MYSRHIKSGGGYDHYGLEGKTIRVMPRIAFETKADPWMYKEQQARVEQETPYFLTVTILPHRNPSGYGVSHPYPTTIFKHDIATGEMILQELDGKRIR